MVPEEMGEHFAHNDISKLVFKSWCEEKDVKLVPKPEKEEGNNT